MSLENNPIIDLPGAISLGTIAMTKNVTRRAISNPRTNNRIDNVWIHGCAGDGIVCSWIEVNALSGVLDFETFGGPKDGKLIVIESGYQSSNGDDKNSFVACM